MPAPEPRAPRPPAVRDLSPETATTAAPLAPALPSRTSGPAGGREHATPELAHLFFRPADDDLFLRTSHRRRSPVSPPTSPLLPPRGLP
ncbi:hypothetical protein NAEX_07902 [Nannocystis exedens]|nr:hypothetical protein NAEX_07902 [Nannocystis exedens]